MNTIVTSKEDILKNSRELIREKGWAAVSIRSVASACGVSVGSIYNYYDSKAELISATVESVWCEIFHRHQTRKIRTCFRLEKGSDFSFSSGLRMKAPVDGVKLRYLVIDRKPITRIGGCDYEVR